MSVDSRSAVTAGASFRLARNAGLLMFCIGVVAGCGSPDRANVALRRERDEHLAEIATLKQQLTADRQRIAALEKQVGTLQTLPQARLDQLFTTHEISLGRLTGGYDADPSKPGDEAIKVYLAPIDDWGDAIKATGQVTVELFDLDRPDEARLASWEFSPGQLKEHWRSLGPLEAYVLTCPLEKPPGRADLLLRVTFVDVLTGRMVTKVQQIRVKLPPDSTQVSG